MLKPPEFDLQNAHRFFAVDCFNRTWDYIDKPDRTPEDTDAMIRLAVASLWHWMQREDCTPKNLSVGHWQCGRVYGLAIELRLALRHAQLSLEHAKDEAPFYLGYAHEGLARVYLFSGSKVAFQNHMKQARKFAALVEAEDERKLLEADLDGLERDSEPKYMG